MHLWLYLKINIGVARVYFDSPSYVSDVTCLRGISYVGDEPSASQEQLCPRSQLRVS